MNRKDQRLEILRQARDGTLDRILHEEGGMVDDRFLPCMELIESGHLKANVEGRRGKMPNGVEEWMTWRWHDIANIEITTKGRDYLALLERKTWRSRLGRISVWVLIAIAGFLIRDVYDFAKARLVKASSKVEVTVAGDRRGVRLAMVNRGDKTMFQFWRFKQYTDERDYHADDPAATKELYNYGAKSRPYEMRRAETWEGYMPFGNFAPEIQDPTDGILVLEIQDNLLREPIRKRVTFPKRQP